MKLKDWDAEEQHSGQTKGKQPDLNESNDFETDLEAAEWEDYLAEMKEENQWEEAAQEDSGESPRDRMPEEGWRDERMPEDSEQDSADDERWEESELDSKPGVSYRWKKFNLDSEPDDGSWREEEREDPDSDGRAESRGMTGRQNPKGVYISHGGKEVAGTSDRGQKSAKKEEEEDWEEELPPLKPWTKVLIFMGLAVVAAIICAILWHFAHPEKPDSGDGGDISSQATESLEDSSEQAPKLDLDVPGDEEGQSGESLSGLTPEGTDPGSAGGTGIGSDAASGAGAEAGSGAAGAEDGNGAAGSGTGDGGGTTGTDTGTGTESTPSEPEGEEQEPVSGTEGMAFQDVQEAVTPKDVVNLRKVPNTADADSIVTQARNGETLSRIGINPDTGWSKIDYNGQTLYAVSQYLTTDLSYQPAVKPSDPNRVSTISGRIIIFKNCDDWISPKEYVNLRTEPSTTEGDATVSCQLNYGEKVHRTGYSTDSGWSRVEYNGQVLYVVTSLMYEVDAE